MSFISSLFGGGSSSPQPPQPAAAAPTISSGTVEAVDRETSARLRARRGVDDTILSGGLGNVGKRSGTVQRATLLGGVGP